MPRFVYFIVGRKKRGPRNGPTERTEYLWRHGPAAPRERIDIEETIQFDGRRAALGVGRTAGSRPCPRAGKSRVAPALSPPRRVTAVPKVYHQRHWAWGGPSATDHDWKNAPR